MNFKTILLSMPLVFAIGACGESKKSEEPVKAAQPVEQKPAPKADPPAKVDVHITTETKPAPEPEPKKNGFSITVGGEADVEVK